MATQPPKQDIYGFKTYFRESGYYLRSYKEQFLKALKYFDEAILRTPDDVRALMGRSSCRAKASRYKGALSDISSALKVAPDDYVLRAQKALNTYLVCEFEDALIQNLHHVPYRKKPDNFVMGVMHCSEAIENCIGIRSGHPLRDHFLIIRRLAWKAAFAAAKAYKPVSKYAKKKRKTVRQVKKKKRRIREVKSMKSISLLGINVSQLEVVRNAASTMTTESCLNRMVRGSLSTLATLEGKVDEDEIKDTLYSAEEAEDMIPPAKPFPFRPLQKRTTNLGNYMAEKYLGTMYQDKIFLETFKNLDEVKGPNLEGYNKMLKSTKDGLQALYYKQELLRTRRPFYFIKYQEVTSEGNLKQRQEEELRLLRLMAKGEAENMLQKIINVLKKGHTRQVIQLSDKLKRYCDTKSKKVFPEKDLFLKKMYDLVCQGIYTIYRLNPKQPEWDQEKRIYAMFGFPIARAPSKDSVIKQYLTEFVDFKKLSNLYENRLQHATTREELVWLYHEIARFNYEIKQYEKSKLFCKKCINEARFLENLRWIVNSNMLIARIHVQQKNKNDAKAELYNCIELAKMLGDENLLRYLVKSVQICERLDFDSLRANRLLEQREKQIVEMMPDQSLKSEAAFLFKQMAGMPASRRMTFVPGVQLDDLKKDSRKASYKASIAPKNVSDTSLPVVEVSGQFLVS